jgi:hypothetical protein
MVPSDIKSGEGTTISLPAHVRFCEFSNCVHVLDSQRNDVGRDQEDNACNRRSNDHDHDDKDRRWYRPEDYAAFRDDAFQELCEWIEVATATSSMRHRENGERSQPLFPPPPIPQGLEPMYHRVVAGNVAAMATAVAAAHSGDNPADKPSSAPLVLRPQQAYAKWIVDTYRRLGRHCLTSGQPLRGIGERPTMTQPPTVPAIVCHTPPNHLLHYASEDILRRLSEPLTHSDRIRAWKSATTAAAAARAAATEPR